jgi:hypothetical protein
MSVPAKPDLSGLTADDAEWFDQVAAGKRAAAEGYNSPAGAAQLAAEAAGIEAALRAALARAGPTDLARQFHGVRPAKLAPMLEALAAMGQRREVGSGRYLA